MVHKAEAKKAVRGFEDMIEMAELKALSKASLERPLTDKEYDRMMELKIKIRDFYLPENSGEFS